VQRIFSRGVFLDRNTGFVHFVLRNVRIIREPVWHVALNVSTVFILQVFTAYVNSVLCIVSTVQPYVDYVLNTLVLILSCLPSHRAFSTLFIFLTLLIKSGRHRQMRCAPVFFLT
jgi:hypothetical protein